MPRRCCRGDGGFPRSIDDLWEHADPDEVRRECRAQIERALAWDIDVTHLAPHLTAITLRPGVLRRLPRHGGRVRACRSACRRRSPPSRPGSRSAGWPPRRASSSPTTSTTTGGPAAASVSTRRSATLATGGHRDPRPAGDRHARGAGPVLGGRRRGSTTSPWSSTIPTLPTLLAEVGAVLIGYSELRDVQRAGVSSLAASPERSSSNSGPVGPVDFSLPCM